MNSRVFIPVMIAILLLAPPGVSVPTIDPAMAGVTEILILEDDWLGRAWVPAGIPVGLHLELSLADGTTPDIAVKLTIGDDPSLMVWATCPEPCAGILILDHTISTATLVGRVEVEVVIDADEAIEEVDEEDNVLRATIYVADAYPWRDPGATVRIPIVVERPVHIINPPTLPGSVGGDDGLPPALPDLLASFTPQTDTPVSVTILAANLTAVGIEPPAAAAMTLYRDDPPMTAPIPFHATHHANGDLTITFISPGLQDTQTLWRYGLYLGGTGGLEIASGRGSWQSGDRVVALVGPVGPLGGVLEGLLTAGSIDEIRYLSALPLPGGRLDDVSWLIIADPYPLYALCDPDPPDPAALADCTTAIDQIHALLASGGRLLVLENATGRFAGADGLLPEVPIVYLDPPSGPTEVWLGPSAPPHPAPWDRATVAGLTYAFEAEDTWLRAGIGDSVGTGAAGVYILGIALSQLRDTAWLSTHLAAIATSDLALDPPLVDLDQIERAFGGSSTYLTIPPRAEPGTTVTVRLGSTAGPDGEYLMITDAGSTPLVGLPETIALGPGEVWTWSGELTIPTTATPGEMVSVATLIRADAGQGSERLLTGNLLVAYERYLEVTLIAPPDLPEGATIEVGLLVDGPYSGPVTVVIETTGNLSVTGPDRIDLPAPLPIPFIVRVTDRDPAGLALRLLVDGIERGRADLIWDPTPLAQVNATWAVERAILVPGEGFNTTLILHNQDTATITVIGNISGPFPGKVDLDLAPGTAAAIPVTGIASWADPGPSAPAIFTGQVIIGGVLAGSLTATLPLETASVSILLLRDLQGHYSALEGGELRVAVEERGNALGPIPYTWEVGDLTGGGEIAVAGSSGVTGSSGVDLTIALPADPTRPMGWLPFMIHVGAQPLAGNLWVPAWGALTGPTNLTVDIYPNQTSPIDLLFSNIGNADRKVTLTSAGILLGTLELASGQEASLRVAGAPGQTLTWVVHESGADGGAGVNMTDHITVGGAVVEPRVDLQVDHTGIATVTNRGLLTLRGVALEVRSGAAVLTQVDLEDIAPGAEVTASLPITEDARVYLVWVEDRSAALASVGLPQASAGSAGLPVLALLLVGGLLLTTGLGVYLLIRSRSPDKGHSGPSGPSDGTFIEFEPAEADPAPDPVAELERRTE